MVTCIIIKNAIYVGKNVLRHILTSLCHIACEQAFGRAGN